MKVIFINHHHVQIRPHPFRNLMNRAAGTWRVVLNDLNFGDGSEFVHKKYIIGNGHLINFSSFHSQLLTTAELVLLIPR